MVSWVCVGSPFTRGWTVKLTESSSSGMVNFTWIVSRWSALGECCFSNCCSLKALDLQPLKAIGPGSFSQCSGLRQVSFGDTLEIVGAGAFSKTTFYGQNGKPVPKTADGLRGHSFEGSGGKLRLVAA